MKERPIGISILAVAYIILAILSLLWSGLVAYQILNAEGESSRTDAARERVMRMITDAAFERVEEYFEQED